MRIHVSLILCIVATLACSTKLVNHRIADAASVSNASLGIPWVEPREYDVYVYRGKDDNGTDGVLVYHGRHHLLDKVNDRMIDAGRGRWQTNYEAGFFADGTLILGFGELGELEKAEIETATGTVDAAKATNAVVGIPEALAKKELSQKEAELKRLDTEKKLRQLRRELEAEGNR